MATVTMFTWTSYFFWQFWGISLGLCLQVRSPESIIIGSHWALPNHPMPIGCHGVFWSCPTLRPRKGGSPAPGSLWNLTSPMHHKSKQRRQKEWDDGVAPGDHTAIQNTQIHVPVSARISSHFAPLPKCPSWSSIILPLQLSHFAPPNGGAKWLIHAAFMFRHFAPPSSKSFCPLMTRGANWLEGQID